MNVIYYKELLRWVDDLDGVFTIADLRVMLDQKSDATFYRIVDDFLRHEILIKVKRGIYAMPDASLAVISSRIDPHAYISTGTVLAQKALIGSIPARKVQAVKTGCCRRYECPLGTIEHIGIHPALYFGFESQGGQLVATPEKAFLDVCYLHFKGRRFSFDPHSDVHFDELDRDRIHAYLARYDMRFKGFFERIWGDML